MLKEFFEWPSWEGFMHMFFFLLNLLVLYLLISNKNNRTMTNLLLYTILIGIVTLVHQVINGRNHMKTDYKINYDITK